MTDGAAIGDEGYFLNIKCHERPMTDARFNMDGDLVFTAGKDSRATLLRVDGEVLGEYRRHEGSIFSLVVDRASEHLVTGSADQTVILWDVCTGNMKSQVEIGSVVKGLDFFESGQQCIVCGDDLMGKSPVIGTFDLRTNAMQNPFMPSSVPTKVLLQASEDSVVYSDTNGSVSTVDLRISRAVQTSKIHTSKINNIRSSRCRSFFISASNDSQAKIVDFDDLSVLKTFACEEPINCAAMFNANDKAICVGGINARDVTTTKGKSSFDANFFDIVTCEKVGAYSTHFGTINVVDVHPGGKMYCSGGEEGTLSILAFGKDFSGAKFTRFN